MVKRARAYGLDWRFVTFPWIDNGARSAPAQRPARPQPPKEDQPPIPVRNAEPVNVGRRI